MFKSCKSPTIMYLLDVYTFPILHHVMLQINIKMKPLSVKKVNMELNGVYLESHDTTEKVHYITSLIIINRMSMKDWNIPLLQWNIFTLNNRLHNFFELQQVYLCKFITKNKTILKYKNNWPGRFGTACIVLLLLSSTQSAKRNVHQWNK